MSNRQTSKDLHSVISSQELAVGQEPYSLRDGVQTDLFGQEVLPVSLSQQQDYKKDLKTKDISGLSSTISSASSNLQLSLWSKLRQLSKKDGLTKSRRIWKHKTTPSGRLYSQLVVSAHFINAQDYGLWPTPIHSDGRGSAGVGKRELPNISKLAHWPTVTTQDNNQVCGEGAAANYPKRGTTLGGAARLTQNMELLGSQLDRSFAETIESDSSHLNPRFSLWLMGYPIEWAYCGERVTRSSRKRQRKS